MVKSKFTRLHEGENESYVYFSWPKGQECENSKSGPIKNSWYIYICIYTPLRTKTEDNRTQCPLDIKAKNTEKKKRGLVN